MGSSLVQKAVHKVYELVVYFVPFGLMVHNYGRVIQVLLSSLKENQQLVGQGNQSE